MTPTRLGFSNARMAYDDLLARLLLTIEQGGLTEKVTALRITTRYRVKDPFSDRTIGLAHDALETFLNSPLQDGSGERMKWNKATIHTWLCMAAKLSHEGSLPEYRDALIATIEVVESWRAKRGSPSQHEHGENVPLAIFHDRATARVADVSSVVLRDLTGWMIFQRTRGTVLPFLVPAEAAWEGINPGVDAERYLSSLSTEIHWGDAGWL